MAETELDINGDGRSGGRQRARTHGEDDRTHIDPVGELSVRDGELWWLEFDCNLAGVEDEDGDDALRAAAPGRVLPGEDEVDDGECDGHLGRAVGLQWPRGFTAAHSWQRWARGGRRGRAVERGKRSGRRPACPRG